MKIKAWLESNARSTFRLFMRLTLSHPFFSLIFTCCTLIVASCVCIRICICICVFVRYVVVVVVRFLCVPL